MKSKYSILFILIAIVAVFLFWPSLLGAHYNGLISCPIFSTGGMEGCANIAHANILISHISDFKILLSCIFAVGALFFILKIFRGYAKGIIDSVDAKSSNKNSQYIKLVGLIADSFKADYLLASGLRKGILNTKVF